MTNPGELQNQILASEAYQIFLRLQAIRRSYLIFEGNYQDFMQLLNRLYDPAVFFPLMAVDNRPELLSLLLDISRRLHNLVSSACMLIEHTEKMIPLWYSRDEQIMSRFNKRTRTDFTTNELHAFITGLRNFTLHENLPLVDAHIRATRQSTTSNEFLTEWAFGLNKSALERYTGWSAKAKAFLNNHTEAVNIRVVIEQYYEHVTDFHNWLQTTLDAHHRKELDWLEDMDNKLQKAMEGLV